MFFKEYLRGAAQVMFQGSALTGFLTLLGIFWSAYVGGNPAIGWSALIGLVTATSVGILIDRNSDDAQNGLYGFNGTLVGCAFGTFLNCCAWQTWVLLVLGSAASVWVRRGMNNVFKQWGINSLTMPFVIITWISLLATREFGLLGTHAIGEPTLYAHTTLPFTIDWATLFVAWLNGISQVFLTDAPGAGIFFIVALACTSGAAAIWAMLGSAISLATAIALGGDGLMIIEGMYGFSATLTAIALGCTFYKPGIRSGLWCVLGIVTTVLIQAALNALMLPYGIATLTAPFCIATWIFLLPRYKLDKTRPNHTRWHDR